MGTIKSKIDIIQSLKRLWGFQLDTELADYLGSRKQAIHKYTNVGEGVREDIQRKMITRLLEHIERLDAQLPTEQDRIRLVVLEELAKQAGK